MTYVSYIVHSSERTVDINVAEHELFHHVYIAQCIPTKWRQRQ